MREIANRSLSRFGENLSNVHFQSGYLGGTADAAGDGDAEAVIRPLLLRLQVFLSLSHNTHSYIQERKRTETERMAMGLPAMSPLPLG